VARIGVGATLRSTKQLLFPGKYLFNFYQGIFPLKVNTLTFSPVELR